MPCHTEAAVKQLVKSSCTDRSILHIKLQLRKPLPLCQKRSKGAPFSSYRSGYDRQRKNLETVMVSRFFMVAGEGFEPPTSGLWATFKVTLNPEVEGSFFCRDYNKKWTKSQIFREKAFSCFFLFFLKLYYTICKWIANRDLRSRYRKLTRIFISGAYYEYNFCNH